MLNSLDTLDVTFNKKYHSIYKPDYSKYRVSYAVYQHIIVVNHFLDLDYVNHTASLIIQTI